MICIFTRYSGDDIQKTEMGGACGTYGDRRDVYRVLVGRHDEKNRLEDRFVDNIKMGVQ
jgi:hypothetical protein